MCARQQGLVLVIKDEDFLDLSVTRGCPPKVVCLAIGNASNAVTAIPLLQQAETIERFCSHPGGGRIPAVATHNLKAHPRLHPAVTRRPHHCGWSGVQLAALSPAVISAGTAGRQGAGPAGRQASAASR